MSGIHYVAGPPVTFATYHELASYGFLWGPSDGTFGAISSGGTNYTFYGTAGTSSSCKGTPNGRGAFTFAGTLDHVTGSNGCTRLFGPGDGPAGWIFNRNYSGGGQVVRFKSGSTSGWLMPFHGEFWWLNPATPDHKCYVGTGTSEVDCFYGSLGLAVSTDNGKTFKVVGEIFQPSQPMSVFTGSGNTIDPGYGSLIVADANGKHVDNPPADPSGAYFYLFYRDFAPGLPGVCATAGCMGVARAPYLDVVAAALSGDPHKVATVFHKYDGASPDPWTQPSTSDTPDNSGTAGKFAPLWTDQSGYPFEVIYDSAFDVYLAVYTAYSGNPGVTVRTSTDLIHWSEPIGAPYSETGRNLIYPTIMGETGDPTIAGTAPRVYFSSFPNGKFPDYSTSVFEGVQLTLSANASPTISTTLISPSGPTLATGGSTTDSAALSGASSGASGTVTYTLYSSTSPESASGACAGSVVTSQAKAVAAGIVPNTTPFTINSAGYYGWQASYAGDVLDNPAGPSNCEPFTSQASSTATSTRSTTSPTSSTTPTSTSASTRSTTSSTTATTSTSSSSSSQPTSSVSTTSASSTVPEFPAWMLVPVMLASLALVSLLARKSLRHRP